MRIEFDRPSPEAEPPRPAGVDSVPPIESPPIESPRVESPPVESPPVESPPVESPPVESPRVESPRVDARPIELIVTEQVPTELRRPAKVESPAARTARLLVTRGDREFLDWQSAVFGTAETAGAKEAAAREIFTRVASIVAQSVTLPNQRQALRRGLLILVEHDCRPEPVTDAESAVRRRLVDWFMGVVTEILRGLAADTILALMLADVHLFVPPSSFVEAILTVCDLLNYVEAA